MLYQGANVEKNQVINCDACIVGSGAAGLTIALELEKHGYKVAVLEAGSEAQSKESQEMYKGKSTGMPYSIAYTRLRVLGGTTQHWSGFCAPLDDEDFEKCNHIKHSGWPITRKDLDPFYIRASQVLKLGSYDPTPKKWINPKKGYSSFDVNEEFTEKVWHFNQPVRFGDTYKNHIKKSARVDVYLDSVVSDLSLQNDSNTVKRATVQSENHTFYVEARQFVLACGGMENPRLLLNFNKQRSGGLGNENDNVGRYFQEHPEFHSLGHVLLTGPKAKTKLYYGHNRVSRTRGASYLQINKKIRDEKKLLNAAFSITPRKYEAQEFDKDIQNITNRLNRHEDYDDFYSHLQCIMEQEPDRDRRVDLDTKKDKFGLFRPKLNVGLTELDYLNIQNTLLEFNSIISRYRLGRMKLKNPDIIWLKEEIQKTLGWGNHHMGTTRMSSNPKDGVVDKNCKVHSLDNLYIGGSSVFTTSGCANPTFTIVALALRISDTLRDNLK